MKYKRLAEIRLTSVLNEIVEVLKAGEEVVIPDLVAILKSIEIITPSEKIKEVIKEIETVLNGAETILPDVIKLLEDLEGLLDV